MKKLRSLFAIVLAVAIICSFTVISASAETTPTTINSEAALITAFGEGGNFKLGANIQLGDYREIAKDVTLDLNGKTIKAASGKSGLNITGGNVVIKDSQGTGKIESSDNSPVIIFGGSLTINGGTFYTEGQSSIFGTNAAIYNKSDSASLTINDGTFTAPKTYAVYNEGTLEINGGTFSSDATDLRKSTVYTVALAPATATINNGKFSMTASDYAIENYGLLTINGGEFTAPKFGANTLKSDGDTTINGGTFTAKSGTAIVKYNGKLTINDCTAKGMFAGLCINYKSNDVVLNGGQYYSNFNMTVQEFVNSSPSGSAAENELIYNQYKLVLDAGISYTEGTDLLGFLGTNRAYYSKSGINQITVDNETGFSKTEAIVVIDNIDPTIKDGANQNIAGAPKDTTISSSVPYKYFFDGTNIIGEVQVDGKTVDPKNYDHKEGSTVITFKKAYLETLSAGKHKVAIISNVAGYKAVAETTLTIDDKIAQTGDNNAIGAFAALTVFAAAGFITLKKKED